MTSAPSAHAHGDNSGRLQSDVVAVAEEGKRAQEILARVLKDKVHGSTVQPLVDSAKKALSRAYAANLAKDTSTAVQLSKVALADAKAAEATLLWAQADNRARAAATRFSELQAKHKQVKAMVTELEAERAQLVLEVDKLREAERARKTHDAKRELEEAGKRKQKARERKKSP